MQMRILLAAAVLALSAVPAHAQQQRLPGYQPVLRNAVYFEGFGNGFIWTVNYERNLQPNLGVRVGAGSVPNIDPGEDPDSYTFPVLLHLRRGSGAIQPELGVGMVVAYLDTSKLTRVHDIEPIEINPALSLGVRAIPSGTRGVFRLAVTPLFDGGEILPWFGGSIGIAF
jgi:hypothetical protein